MERKLYLRLVRSVFAVVVSFVLLIMVSAQVMAETAELNKTGNTELAETVEQIETLTEENFGAVAVQLEAVARAEGKNIASQMLYASLREISNVAAPAAETEAADVSVPAGDAAPGVVVHVEEEVTWSLSGVLPFILVAIVAVGAMLAAFAALRRPNTRRGASAYRPARRRVLREDTFSKGKVLRLDR